MKYIDVPALRIGEILTSYLSDLINEPVYIMVVGANDGNIKDFLTEHLTKSNIKAILVEPIWRFYQMLVLNLSNNKNLSFENVAVDSKLKKRTIYLLDKCEGLPDWSSGLGSFHKKVVLAHGNQINNIHEHIVKEKISCVTLKSLIKKNQFPKLNILQIDTEGHDFEIVKDIDFLKNRPEIIIFEFLHLTTYQYYASISFLDEQGYLVRRNFDSFDLIAIDKKIISQI